MTMPKTTFQTSFPTFAKNDLLIKRDLFFQMKIYKLKLKHPFPMPGPIPVIMSYIVFVEVGTNPLYCRPNICLYLNGGSTLIPEGSMFFVFL